MKIRTGFVSNSSSSSFVLGKNYMDRRQIRELSDMIDQIEEDDYESCIYEDERYFFGAISHHDEHFNDFVSNNDLENFISYGE